MILTIDEKLRFTESEPKRLFQGMYTVEEETPELGEILHGLIMPIIGDGMVMEIRGLKEVLYVDIEMTRRKYNLGEIIEAINSRFKESIQEIEENEKNYEYVYIQCHGAILQEEDKVGESIKEFIKESQLKVVGCMDECRIYEQGASAWFFQGIVMIAVEMGAVAIADKLKRWLEEREEFKEYAKVGTLDSKRLRKNLAYILDDNKVYKYDIIKCNRLDDEEYIVEMRNKYNTYELICNENGDIKDKSITIK